MKTEFIPYTEALALKELGFDEPCFGQFYKHPTQKEEEFRLFHDCVWEDRTTSYWRTNISNHFVSAPTFSQVFRWFREKYDLDYSLLPESSSGHRLSTRTFNIVIYKYYMNMNVQSEIVRIDSKIVRYNKREEAELECLVKLIEIVKEKQL
jgi:hypothetical protein